eukprot:TRINITY_DN600_c0_g1_i1.p1 TRINITY_DN600_c0_g1~~TRINITY_DN600_c0_g1_i1.p1  ORF type:complete len:381 (+),score=68.58 TRINITY_DN600_c0_g1_i1:92-1144(+)
MDTEEVYLPCHNVKAHPITLTQYIQSEQAKLGPKATGALSNVLHSIEIASKYISSRVRAAGLLNLYGLEGNVNVQGEEQKKLDVISNDAFITAMVRCKQICLMVSEENEKPMFVKESSDAKYVIAFDPLDGSSNIDANASIGTIFSIWKRQSEKDKEPQLSDVLQKGDSLVCAGYALYGSATLLVLSTGNSVDGFLLDPATGEFVLTLPKIRTPTKGNIYSINEGNSKYWHEGTKQYVESVKNPKDGKNPYSARYIGSMVADVHRTLVYGGVFCYPADTKSKEGKLRLLYEAIPMAFLVEKSGGKAVDGYQRILDIQPTDIHQRTPVFLGSSQDVDQILEFHAKQPKPSK